MLFLGQKMTPYGPLYHRMDFSDKKSINVFQSPISNFVLPFKQTQWPIPEISVNDPLLGSKIAHFTLKWTFYENIF